MKNFLYTRPNGLENASSILSDGGETSEILAGGTDLLGRMKEYITEVNEVVNIKDLSGMDQIDFSRRNGLRIGALVTLTEIAESDTVMENYPMLAQAAAEIASPQLRNVGTLGGNLNQRPRCWYYREDFDCLKKGGDMCYAFDGENKRHAVIGGGPCFIVHPSDMAVALLAADAEVVVASGGNTRTMPLQDLYHLPSEDPTSETTLEPGEIVTEVVVPAPERNAVSTYLKIKERAVWDFAVVSVGAVLDIRGNTIRGGKIAFGGVAPIPWTEEAVNEKLSGLSVSDSNIQSIADAALADASPLGQNGYKMAMTRNAIISVMQQLTA
jgi:xanthine dehydrogenase YagS FAD-binding subunit